MVSTIRASVCAVSFAIAVPSSTALIESPISVVVSLAACATLPARFLTSSATTAKPLPASPALAASTAALSARIFVWNEISSMALMIFAICFEVSSILCIASSRTFIFSFPESTSFAACSEFLAASPALAALRFTFSDTSESEAESSSTEAACLVAPSERFAAADDTCSAPFDT